MITRRRFLQGIGGAGVACAAGKGAAQSARKPNLVVILADDLGYGELGCYGQKKIQTPNLDQLAAEGMRFLQCYAGAAVCAPSRFTLMTGQHIGRSDTYGQGQRLKPDARTIPKVLKQAGYATCATGKWGLGNDPNAQGFDAWMGFISQAYAHFYYPERIWVNEEQVELPENKGLRENGKYGDTSKGTYIHDRFTDFALDFVKQHKDQPFFLYVPYTIPHMEMIVPEDSMAPYRGKFPTRAYDTTLNERPAGGTKFYDGYGYCSNDEARVTYAGMVSRMDRDVGRIVALLRELNLDENTLILFSSDNGASWWDAGGYDRDFFEGNGPLREGKATYYEGGLRVPLLAWWPGKVAPGTLSSHVTYFPDFLPTLADAAGVDVPGPADGLSLLPTLLGKGKQEEHPYLYWWKAVRMGDWKYVDGELYNLADDIGETRNVAEAHPEVVAKIKAIIAENEIKKPR